MSSTLPRDLKNLKALAQPTSNNDEGILRFMEPLRHFWKTPEGRLRRLKQALGASDDTEGCFTLVTEENLLELLRLHTGPEDAPSGSTAKSIAINAKDMLWYMDSGLSVYQYEVDWTPEWLAELRGLNLPDPPKAWISITQAQEVTGISERTIRDRCGSNFVSQKCYGGVWYLDPTDKKFEYWITKIPHWGSMYRRLLLVEKALTNNPATNDELYELVAEMESAEEITGIYERYSIKKYMQKSLGDMEPQSVEEWNAQIQQMLEWVWEIRLITYYGENV